MTKRQSVLGRTPIMLSNGGTEGDRDFELSSGHGLDKASQPQADCIVAATFKQGNFGAAWFEAEAGMLRVLEDIPECDSPSILVEILLESGSTALLISSGTPVDFIDKIKREFPELQLIIPPTKDYSHDRGLGVLAKFGAGSQANSISKCHTSVACVNALHKHLADEGTVDLVTGIDCSAFMGIDRESMEALGIFSAEDHPNRHSGEKKEGFSLFRLMNRTKSGCGKKMLRSWCLRPLQSIPGIEARQEHIQGFLRDDVSKDLHKLIGHVPNIKSLVSRLKKRPTGPDFSKLLAFFKSAVEIVDLVRTMRCDCDLLRKINGMDTGVLKGLRDSVIQVVDFAESKAANRVVVRPRVNANLDAMKAFYAGLPDFLSGIAAAMSQGYAGSRVESLSLVYFPQIGFLVTIPLEEAGCTVDYLLQGLPELGLELQFATDKFAYLKDAKARELDASIGDVHSEIVDLEVEIILGLQLAIAEAEEVLFTCAESFFELDCLLALTEFSREFRLTQPVLVEEPILDIRGGRHILAELSNETFIPNDCRLDRVALLTGPNSSGKSVFMKQVGQLVFLAHIGCFVPAEEGSVVGLTDRILTRINTTENLVKKESAFSAEIHQVQNIIEEATRSSLVLIDEFGRGTLIGDGIGLFAGLLTWLAQCGGPRTIAISHFHEIHSMGLIENDLIIWWTMDVMTSEESIECYLFRVKEGKAAGSHALHCAKQAGLSGHILSRAEELGALYEARVEPEAIRYSRFGAAAEQAAVQLIQSTLL